MGSNIPLALDVNDIVERYQAGETELALSRSYGVSRNVIRRRILASGITPRGLKEAGLLRYSTVPVEQRRANAAAAHAARRGNHDPFERLCRRAQTRELRAGTLWLTEAQLRDFLGTKGLVAIPQKAIGPYNADLAVETVAVEIFGGGWHASGRHAARYAERCRYILDQGWHLIEIWINVGDHPLTEGSANYIVAFLEHARRDPSMRREHRVIWGTGEERVTRGAYLDK